jgi:hypothetical protein
MQHRGHGTSGKMKSKVLSVVNNPKNGDEDKPNLSNIISKLDFQ